MQHCLYRGDYGPADPDFNATTYQGGPAYRHILATAQNGRQMDALLQRLEHRETVAWCETSGSWHPGPAEGFTLALGMILLPLAGLQILRRLRRGR
jgi:hypothetical protein